MAGGRFFGSAACRLRQFLSAGPKRCGLPDYNYKIGPGDNLNIVVWRNPELSMSGSRTP